MARMLGSLALQVGEPLALQMGWVGGGKAASILEVSIMAVVERTCFPLD